MELLNQACCCLPVMIILVTTSSDNQWGRISCLIYVLIYAALISISMLRSRFSSLPGFLCGPSHHDDSTQSTLNSNRRVKPPRTLSLRVIYKCYDFSLRRSDYNLVRRAHCLLSLLRSSWESHSMTPIFQLSMCLPSVTLTSQICLNCKIFNTVFERYETAKLDYFNIYFLNHKQ